MISDLGLWRGAGRKGVSEPGVARVGPDGGRGTRAHTNHFHHTRSDAAMFELKLPHIPPLGKASATKDTSGTPGPLPHLTSRRISPPSRFRASSEPPKHQQRGYIHITCFNPSEHRP